MTTQQEIVHVSGCSNRRSVEEYQSWLRLFYILDIVHGRQLLPFQWNSFQIVPQVTGKTGTLTKAGAGEAGFEVTSLPLHSIRGWFHGLV